jgi:hypothetical protein
MPKSFLNILGFCEGSTTLREVGFSGSSLPPFENLGNITSIHASFLIILRVHYLKKKLKSFNNINSLNVL